MYKKIPVELGAEEVKLHAGELKIIFQLSVSV
jgi:hypothetical protein